MAYEVLARKWRPQVFQDVIGQEHVTLTLVNAIRTDRLAHAYLFSGARGVGKTSVARILAKAINCKEGEPGVPCNRCPSCTEITSGSSVDVQEIDGASNRGIDEIRDLRENIKYMPTSSRFRVYIIDEVHMLTLPAFNALLKTLEEPPPHVKFIFATTEPHKVPITILSRCQRFDFKRIPVAKIVQHLGKITAEEGIEINPSGLALIAKEAEGSMRDAQSLLDQVIAYTGSKVKDRDIADILGLVDRALLLETTGAVIEGKVEQCFRIVDKVYNYGYDLKEFYRSLMDQFRNLLVSLVAPGEDLLDVTESDLEVIRKQARMAGEERLQQTLNLLISREEDLRYSSHPRLVLEVLLVKLCSLGSRLSFDALLKKIEELERRLSDPLSSTPEPLRKLSDPGIQWKEKTPEERPVSLDWDGFLVFLSSKSGLIANVLKEFSLLESSGDTVVLSKGGNPFSADYFEDAERMDRLLRYCRQYFNREVKIKIVGERRKENGNLRPPKKEGSISRPEMKVNLPPSVQEVLDMFQGELKGEVPSGNSDPLQPDDTKKP
ncbi:MAG: DNA polymerase III subunit gamma/tau [Deltaproteobacteria bacterium]|nr:DNA polymerase III subunit gamma/tau [Deltaproteobacteria bacterium]